MRLAGGITNGRVRVRYNYARYGYTRGGGKTWHGGIDLELLDDKEYSAPYYKDGTKVKFKVTRARIVTYKSNRTWEWGYYICLEVQNPPKGSRTRYIYLCHNAKLLVKAGDIVESGDLIAVMGNTGNAALADPPYEHVHFECRKTALGTGIDPTEYCGCSNEVGTYGEEPAKAATGTMQKITIGPVSNGDAMKFYNLAKELKLTDIGLYKAKYV